MKIGEVARLAGVSIDTVHQRTRHPQERMSEYGRLFEHALISRERTSAGLTFRFQPRPSVDEWIRDLSQREAACCPFFNYTISTTDNAEITWLIATKRRSGR